MRILPPCSRARLRKSVLLPLLVLMPLLLVALLGGDVRAQVVGSIAVYPTTSSLEVPGTRQFSAYVPIVPNAITWLVNDVPGGNAAFGTISSTGFYTPPAVIPVANVITIKARSTAFPSAVGSATLTLTRPYPWLWSTSPSSIPQGNFSVKLNGANFAPDSQALVNGVPVTTTYTSSTSLTAKGTASQLGPIQFAVRQPGPGVVTGNSVSASVVVPPPPPPPVTVAVAPVSTNVTLGNTQSFAATVGGSANTSVTWSVNGSNGGSAASGTITSGGLYTAPAVMPASATVTVRATANVNPSSFAQSTVTLVSPVSVTVAPGAISLMIGNTQTFAATVTGSANTSVIWSVNGTAGGSAQVGTVSAAGLYTPPAMVPAPNVVTVRATSVASPAAYSQSLVTLSAPEPPPAWLSGARFLEQSSFGPTPQSLAKLKQEGIEAYLDEQFTMPETQIFTPTDNSMGALRQWILHNYTTAPDQLRQRVAYALSQIVVTSANKLIYPDENLPWLRLLSQHAFGNYRDLLRDVTMSPSMGKYLDLANSKKPGLAGGANENYARELMQLFSIGLWQLNQDGSQVMVDDSPVSTYDQQTVHDVARALTGWTYATAPGATPTSTNNEYFGAPMETRASNHDFTAKAFLGCHLPAGQSVSQDLDSVLDCLMAHPNTAPFIATRLIRSLVTSNPTPGYIQRVADVFAGAGGGTAGDLKAVVTAILLDAEARQDQAMVNQGRLKDPILQISGFLRALNGQFSSTQQLSYLFEYMSQAVLTPNSVFSWFSPLYHVPGSPLFGPEFQIYSPTEATLRGNLIFALLSNPGSDASLDLAPFQMYGNDMPGLVEAVNQRLLYGRMPDGMKQKLITAATPGYDAPTRIQTVLYLTALSGQYAVQY